MNIISDDILSNKKKFAASIVAGALSATLCSVCGPEAIPNYGFWSVFYVATTATFFTYTMMAIASQDRISSGCLLLGANALLFTMGLALFNRTTIDSAIFCGVLLGSGLWTLYTFCIKKDTKFSATIAIIIGLVGLYSAVKLFKQWDDLQETVYISERSHTYYHYSLGCSYADDCVTITYGEALRSNLKLCNECRDRY